MNSLNKHGFWTTRTIEFNDMLELYPYLGHIISSAASDENKETIYISENDYNIQRELEALEHGYEYNIPDYVKDNYKLELLNTVKLCKHNQ